MRRALMAGAFLPGLGIVPAPLRAQVVTPVRWRFSAEAGGAAGGVWLDGPGVPRVSSGVGFTFAAGARRPLSGAVDGGAAIRVSVQPLDVREGGATWSGGTLAQYDLLALFSARTPSPTFARTAVEGGVGAALLTGADHLLPFRNTTRVAPMGALGVAVTLGGAESARRDVALVARCDVMRKGNSGDAGEGGVTAGWVRRVSAGLRITR